MSTEDSFPKKYAKVIEKLLPFKNHADSLSVDELKKLIVTCEGNIYTVEQEKEADERLRAAKEIVKELSAPSAEAIKILNAKKKYAMHLLESKGQEIGGPTEGDDLS